MKQVGHSDVEAFGIDELILRQDLIARIKWVSTLRWIAIGIFFFLLTIWNFILQGIANPLPVYLIIGVMGLYNLVSYEKLKDITTIKRRFCLHLITDLVMLTLFIYLSSEGIENPFIVYFTLHIVIASVILSRKMAYLLAALSVFLLSSLHFLTKYSILPRYNLNGFLPESVSAILISTEFSLPLIITLGTMLFLTVHIMETITRKERMRTKETQQLKRNLEGQVQKLQAAEKKIKDEHNKLIALVDCMQEGIVFTEPPGIISIFNKTAQDMQQQVSQADNPFDSERLAEMFSRFAKGDAIQQGQNHINNSQTFESTYTPVSDELGTYLGTALVVRDITKQKQAEQQLIFSAKMSAVGELSAGVAHEVNNPLDGLLNCIRRMHQDPGNLEQNNKYLELMTEAVGRIESTVRQILDFSRPHELTTTDVNLNHIVDKTIALIEYKAGEKGIQIEKEFQEDLTAISGDKHLLEQLTLNLALNAIAAMQYGGLLRFQTGWTASEGLPGASGIYLKVIDTGVGISEEVREHIFKMFYTTSETGDGLGLGLAVSDWIVKKHRGIIEVESEVGKGSTFCVKIPCIRDVGGERRESDEPKPFRLHPQIETGEST